MAKNLQGRRSFLSLLSGLGFTATQLETIVEEPKKKTKVPSEDTVDCQTYQMYSSAAVYFPRTIKM
jgi:hypothetical protein